MWFRSLLLIPVMFLQACAGGAMKPWHELAPSADYSASQRERINDFSAYIELEERVFAQLADAPLYSGKLSSGHTLTRYMPGNAADPTARPPNWNRSFEWPHDGAVGGVLLLHGMSDSPYSLRAIAESLHREGYWVLGLRLPGHGTTPAALLDVKWEDMAAAVQLAAVYLSARMNGRPLHVIGYSNGAALALNLALDALEYGVIPPPESLVLISPAIGLHGAAGFARWKRRLSAIPGLGGLAWLTVEPEFDPYKYNSFTTNAAEQVYRLTQSITRRLVAFQSSSQPTAFPRTLVFKSNLDATVSTSAVVSGLLTRLEPGRHELVVFDVNRYAAKSILLLEDPHSLAIGLMGDDTLPFALTLVTNEHPDTMDTVVRRQPPFSSQTSESTRLQTPWPQGVLSLSHVALPFPPDDPLYGRDPPEDSSIVYLGQMAVKGERGTLTLSSEWLLRMRHNPFYAYLEDTTLRWLHGPVQDAH